MIHRFQGIAIGVLVSVLLTTGIAYAKQIKESVNIIYDNIKIFINGKECATTDVNGDIVEPFIIDGTTYVPIRAVSQALDKEVRWDESNKRIMIYDSSFSKNDISNAKITISEYFRFFSEKDYEKMKSMVTGELLNYDFSQSVFGMSTAKLIDCQYIEEYSDISNGTLSFLCSFEMTPATVSVYVEDATQTAFYIEVKKSNGKFLLNEFYTG